MIASDDGGSSLVLSYVLRVTKVRSLVSTIARMPERIMNDEDPPQTPQQIDL